METNIHTRGYTSSVGGPALTQDYIQALWESSMEIHNHTGYTSDRGSPAWKQTFTQEDIAYRLCGREYTHRLRLGPDFGGRGRV